MATATLGQIEARLSEIDDLLFKGETGQIPLRRGERGRLKDEAQQILEILAKALAPLNNMTAQEVYEMRDKNRSMN
jgi:hypothetical protein